MRHSLVEMRLHRGLGERPGLSEADRTRLVRLLTTIRETTAALDGADVLSTIRPRRRRRSRA